MREPLLAPALALAAGVAATRLAPFSTPEICTALATALALTLIAYYTSTRRMAFTCCLLALVFAGMLAAVLHKRGAAPELDARFGETVILSGCVVEPPIFSEDREQFVLELAPGARARVNLYLREGEDAPPLRYGQRIELDAKIRHPHNYQNPGGFDYAGYLARKEIFWNASTRAGGIRILHGSCGSPFWSVIYRLRAAALERLESLYAGDAYKTAMMQAILIGESSRLEKVWTEDFRRTGTYHALVISGLHISVLAGLFLFLWRICALPEKTGLALTTAAGFLYALVAGWQAPVVRPAAGFALLALARYFYRRARVLNTLAAVAIGFLLFDPEQLFEASFQLSFLSVAAIGGFALPVIERTTGPLAAALGGLGDSDRDLHLDPRGAHFRVELRLLAETMWLWTRVPQRWCLLLLGFASRAVLFGLEAMLISAVVQAGLLLPMIYYFHRVSITGLSANLLIVPLMSAVVPFGFAAIFTGWRVPATVAGWLLSASGALVRWHAGWEPRWRIPDPPFWLACACAGLLLVTLTLRYTRAVKTRIAFAALCAAAGVMVLAHPFEPRAERGALELTAIDVGQGDSLFIALPKGKLMLLDGGGLPVFGRRRKPRLDIGEDVVSPYLWSRSVRRLDAVAVSHLHEDHFGGLPTVIANFRPRELWVAITAENADWKRLVDAASRAGTRIVRLRGGAAFSYGGAHFDVLSPGPGRISENGAVSNNDSLVLRVAYGHRSFLLSGDAERQIEADLFDRNSLSKTDVIKVAHHGGRNTTSDFFLDAVHPCFALISAGYENSYNLPHPSVLERLAQSHTEVFRTDELGAITIKTDGRRLWADTYAWAAEQHRGLYGAF